MVSQPNSKTADARIAKNFLQINPDAGHLGGKFGFIFFGLGLIVSILGWWLYPETKGVRLKRLDELYAKGITPQHSRKH